MKLLISLLFTLYSLPLSAESGSESPKEKILIGIVGDSISDGYGVESSKAYPALVENKLQQKGFSVEIINSSESGRTASRAYQGVKWLLSQTQPDLLLLQLGGNDALGGTDPDLIKQYLAKAIEFAQSQNIRVLLAGMQIFENWGKEYAERYREIFVELGETYSIAVIPFLLEGVGGERAYNLADGIHPNPEGHQIIAENVASHLESLLKEFKSNER